jgi:YtkA-like
VNFIRKSSPAVALGYLWILGCNSETAPSTELIETPLIRQAISNHGNYSVDLFTAPEQPPTFGKVTVKLFITDNTTKRPCSGLTVNVTPVMPSMGHGTSEVPTAQDLGDGLYVFDSVNLLMPGQWELLTEIVDDSQDSITFSIDVR